MRGEVNAVGEAPGLYVHVPFCVKTCDYCAFYQTTPTVAAIDRYLDGIEREVDLVPWNGPVGTIFWGGGTPGLLSPDAIRRLGALMARVLLPSTFNSQPGFAPEFSVELAPATVTDGRLEALRGIGVTRVSLGVQSFDPALLEAIGRPHTVEQVERAQARIRAAGFQSVNLDLMFALPGQTDERRREDVARAVALAPDHISTYCLTFEEDTALWTKLSQGKVKLDPEREARHYEATWEQLEEAGYAQYEVSNFSRPGHACRHNLNTWAMGDWIGIGPSAASQHAGWRGSNVADLDAWHAGLMRGVRAERDRVEVTPALRAEDALVFGLRMNAGVDTRPWRNVCPEAPWASVDALLSRLASEGLAEVSGRSVRLTRKGRLVADAVGVEIMEAFSGEAVGT